ncbi:unnamed protein product, partial [Staurois parvus]
SRDTKEDVSLVKHTQHSLTTSLQGNSTPFLPRPISSFQRCCALNDNCAVMQHCTHMTFFIIFCDRQSFLLVVFIHLSVFLFFLKSKTTENLGKKKFF